MEDQDIKSCSMETVCRLDLSQQKGEDEELEEKDGSSGKASSPG